jgi:LPS export ABC transporter protein LptC
MKPQPRVLVNKLLRFRKNKDDKKVQSIKYKVQSIIFILLFFFGACKNTREELEAVSTKKEPLEFGRDVELFYSDSAILKFVLKAPILERYVISKDSSYVEFPKGTNVQFYDQTGAPDSKLECDYAIQYEKSDRVLAQKNVRVYNRNGDKLNTEKLWWDKKSKKVYTDAFVKIQTPDEIIYGDGLESNEDFTKYRILNIKGTLTVKNEELP